MGKNRLMLLKVTRDWRVNTSQLKHTEATMTSQQENSKKKEESPPGLKKGLKRKKQAFKPLQLGGARGAGVLNPTLVIATCDQEEPGHAPVRVPRVRDLEGEVFAITYFWPTRPTTSALVHRFSKYEPLESCWHLFRGEIWF